MNNLFTKSINTQIGKLYLTTDMDKIIRIDFENTFTKEEIKESDDDPAIMRETIKQLNEYFDGKRRTFSLKRSESNTDFKNKVYKALADIEYGSVATYKDIARKIGNEKASRAVGNANNKNTIPIIIPCHRIVGSSGNLIGYAGELWRKEWLLNHEKKYNINKKK